MQSYEMENYILSMTAEFHSVCMRRNVCGEMDIHHWYAPFAIIHHNNNNDADKMFNNVIVGSVYLTILSIDIRWIFIHKKYMK